MVAMRPIAVLFALGFAGVLTTPAAAQAKDTTKLPLRSLEDVPVMPRPHPESVNCPDSAGVTPRVSAQYDTVADTRDVDRPARLLQLGRPRTPPQQEGVPARVVLRFVVSGDGTIAECSMSVVTFSNALFVPAAAATIEAQRFAPALRGGKAVATWVSQAVTWQ